MVMLIGDDVDYDEDRYDDDDDDNDDLCLNYASLQSVCTVFLPELFIFFSSV